MVAADFDVGHYNQVPCHVVSKDSRQDQFGVGS